jgi:hypothetical protein
MGAVMLAVEVTQAEEATQAGEAIARERITNLAV